MRKKVLFVLTALTTAVLLQVLSPISAKAIVAGFPAGVYITTITAEDVAGLPDPYPAYLTGDWEMSFDGNGHFAITNLTTGKTSQGVYMANPVMIIFGDKDTGELACNPPGSAAYRWSRNGNTFTFKSAGDRSDRCLGRYIVMTSHTFVKRP